MTTYNECVMQIQQMLQSTVAKGDVVGEDVDLIEELGLASLDVMELIEQLEDVFDIAFPINELGDVRTISDLASRVQQLTDR
ncbi:MAG: acyl carrier protein [Gammaproteobacteria bacterium]|nr:MAG: acyl carrier protein [Gammaproteobacteria bacterium]